MVLRRESTLTMNDGFQIPIIGLGVYMTLAGKDTYQAVLSALRAGYRHIDTAKIYGNEADVGRAIRDSGLPRDKVFVTTKLWNTDQGYENSIRACKESLERLKLSYVDLYLIHWPVEKLRLESWRGLVELKKQGLAKSIGVSNFMISHLDELSKASSVLPTVNQIEFNPFLYQQDLLKYCQQKNIVVEAYSPLTRGEKLQDKSLLSVSKKFKKSPAQVMLRWGLEHGLVVLPKSKAEARIYENIGIFDFELDPESMSVLNKLNADFRVSWDPTGIK